MYAIFYEASIRVQQWRMLHLRRIGIMHDKLIEEIVGPKKLNSSENKQLEGNP